MISASTYLQLGIRELRDSILLLLIRKVNSTAGTRGIRNRLSIPQCYGRERYGKDAES